MTPADIVAEALAHALATTDGNYAPSRFCTLRTDLSYALPPEWEGPMPEFFTEPSKTHVAYGRADFTLAALAHMAERCAKAEERAERLRKSLDDVMYAICENALRDEGEHAGAVCKRAIEADKAVLRG